MRLSIIFLFITFLSFACQSELAKPDISKSNKTYYFTISQSKKLIENGDRLYKDPRTLLRVTKSLSNYEKVINSNMINDVVCWKGAMACSYLSKHVQDDSLKSYYAEKGSRYGKKGIDLNIQSGESHYYYAVNLGLYADVNRFEALSLISIMEKAALEAIKLNPKLDNGGGYRFLGRLYFEAPSFTVGDIKKGLRYLKKACEIAPNYPPNLLDYSKALIEEGEKEIAKIYLHKVLLIQHLFEENSKLPLWKTRARKLLGD